MCDAAVADVADVPPGFRNIRPAAGATYTCAWCDEPIKGVVRATGEAPGVESYFHEVCMIRMACGSVGHLQKTCSHYGGDREDPEGVSKRMAATAAYSEWQRQRAGPAPQEQTPGHPPHPRR